MHRFSLRRINPIFLFIGFNLLVFLLRDYVFPASSNAQLTDDLRALLANLGVLS
jgi:hypothetical protein